MVALPPRLAPLPRESRDGLVIVDAATALTRLRGLAGLAPIDERVALRLRPCSAIHTFGMRFALDLVWLDGDGAVLRIDEHVAPRRHRGARRARAVIETRAGCGERFAEAFLDPHASRASDLPRGGT